jgi:hypothetical protein
MSDSDNVNMDGDSNYGPRSGRNVNDDSFNQRANNTNYDGTGRSNL